MKTLRDKHYVDMFKLRASFGQIGDDYVAGRWLYMDQWSNSGNYRQSLTGVDPAKSPYTWWQQTQEGNTALQWETATKYDFAVDFAVLNNLISGSVDFFSERRSDILISNRRDVPS